MLVRKLVRYVESLLPKPSIDHKPKPRGRSATICRSVFCFVLITVGYCTSSDQKGICIHILISTGVSFFFCTSLDLLYRFSNFWEELRHINSRYSSCTELIQDALPDLNLESLIGLVIAIPLPIILSLQQNRNIFITFLEFGPLSIYISFLAGCVSWKMFHIDQSGALNESLVIERLKRMDYGSGIALSFFFGYLNIVLPRSSDILGRMVQYRDTHDVNFPAFKLFILIPLSLHCPESLENSKNPGISMAGSLEPKRITRAGVKDREYKSTVYKIKDENDEIVYFCGEYACPLLTFKEVLQSSGMSQRQYSKHKAQLVLHFYEMLKAVLKDYPDCNERCELMFYDDQNPEENVRRLILDALRPYRNAIG